MGNKTVNYKQVACWLSPEQSARLQSLHEKTRLTKQVLLREAVDRLLARYERRANHASR